jgi:hypothetical protein
MITFNRGHGGLAACNPAVKFVLAALLFSWAGAGGLFAQVPHLLGFQGRVLVGNVNYSGTGQFKFALVNADGSETYWSNDGTSAAGSEPVAGVALGVANGLYSVLLGDTALPNMAVLPPAVFGHADVRLRVWFDDGVHGSQLLLPDQRIAAVGYALVAATVPDGSITSAKLAAGSVTGYNLAAGSITAGQLAIGAAAANLNQGGAAIVQTYSQYNATANSPALAQVGGTLVIGAQASAGDLIGGFTGSYSLGALRVDTPAYFSGGTSGPLDVPSQYWTKMYALGTTSNSQLNWVKFGDSVADKVTGRLLRDAQRVYGNAGAGGMEIGPVLGGSAVAVTGDYVYYPTGSYEKTMAAGDTIAYQAATGVAVDRVSLPYVLEPGAGSFKVQAATASAPAYVYSDWADEGPPVSASAPAIDLGFVTITRSTAVAIRVRVVSVSGGTNRFLRPSFKATKTNGFFVYGLNLGGIALADMNTTNTNIRTKLWADIAPDVITVQLRDNGTHFYDDLETLAANFGPTAPFIFLGVPPGMVSASGSYVMNANPTVSTIVENAQLAAFARRHNYVFWNDSAAYTATDGTVQDFVRLGWQGDGTHVDAKADTASANRLAADLHLFDNVFGVSPLDFSATQGRLSEALTINSMNGTKGAPTNPTWFGVRLGENHDQNYTPAAQYGYLDFRQALRIRNEDGAQILTLNANGTAQFGPSGYAIGFAAPLAPGGPSKGMLLDSVNGEIAIWNGNSESGGGLKLTRGSGGDLRLQSNSNGANVDGSINLILGRLAGGTITVLNATTTSFNVFTPVRLPSYTVASLPNAAAAGAGATAFVTDATVPLSAGAGTIPVGGGSHRVPVFSDGVNWIMY